MSTSGRNGRRPFVRGMIRGVGRPGRPALARDLSVIGIERALLTQKQMECPEFGAIYAAAEAWARVRRGFGQKRFDYVS